MAEYSITSKLQNVEDRNDEFDKTLETAYDDANSDDIVGNLENRKDLYSEYENLHDNISDVQGNINAYDDIVRDTERKKVQKGNFLSASTLRMDSFNDGMTAIFIALLVSLVILVILASGIIDVTLAIIGIVIALTISIIYAAGVMVMGGNLSSTLPGIFDWDFTLRSE